MSKSEFLSVLRDRLSGLPQEDIERSIDYYSEIIDDCMEDGLSEEEAVQTIGSMEDVVSQILADTPLTKLVTANVSPNRTFKVWEIIGLILGFPIWFPLLTAAVIVILAIYIVIWTVVVTLYAVDLSFAASGFAGILGSLMYITSGTAAQGAFLLGAGLVCGGIAVLMFFGFNQVSKGILFLSRKILLYIKTYFARRGNFK